MAILPKSSPLFWNHARPPFLWYLWKHHCYLKLIPKPPLFRRLNPRYHSIYMFLFWVDGTHVYSMSHSLTQPDLTQAGPTRLSFFPRDKNGIEKHYPVDSQHRSSEYIFRAREESHIETIDIMMVNFMGQPNWAMRWTDIWSNIILGMSVKYF